MDTNHYWSLHAEENSLREICQVIDGQLSTDPSGWYSRAKIRHGSAHDFLTGYLENIDKRWWSFDGRVDQLTTYDLRIKGDRKIEEMEREGRKPMAVCTKCGGETPVKVWIDVDTGLCTPCYREFVDRKHGHGPDQDNSVIDQGPVDGSNLAGGPVAHE